MEGVARDLILLVVVAWHWLEKPSNHNRQLTEAVNGELLDITEYEGGLAEPVTPCERHCLGKQIGPTLAMSLLITRHRAETDRWINTKDAWMDTWA